MVVMAQIQQTSDNITKAKQKQAILFRLSHRKF